MTTILERIVATKREEVAELRRCRSIDDLRREAERVEVPRDFARAVMAESSHGVQLIAEIKKASPSAGVVVQDFDPVAIARAYHRAGAGALSVLTDRTYFQGELEFIRKVKDAVPLPVLRKDFIVDESQVYESRAAGADAILLIAGILSAGEVTSLHAIARKLCLAVLVEVHDELQLQTVLASLGQPGVDRYILGINNRDLGRQVTDLSTTSRLGRLLPSGTPFVSESGIATPDDVARVRAAGACGILVGESLLRNPNVEDGVRALLRVDMAAS